MAILIIDQTAQKEITKAIEHARGQPNAAPDRWIILGSYRVAITFEEHGGSLVRRLSISAAAAGTLPSASAVRMILEAFGFDKNRLNRTWLEEIEPGHRAFNVDQED